MKGLKYILTGILFGIVMTKSEAISWYRIQEMFLFHSIHMYGIIGVAVILGIIQLLLIKKIKLKDHKGQEIELEDKNKSFPRYLIGGIIFGLGWAMTGACPGPMYTLLGHGFSVFIIIIISALSGTFLYGLIRHKLPH
jgi:uncharacterized membrane protein YedE/YeeE